MTPAEDTTPATPTPASGAPSPSTDALIVVGAAVPSEPEPTLEDKFSALEAHVAELDATNDSLVKEVLKQGRRISLLESMIAPAPAVPPIHVAERKDEEPAQTNAAPATCVHCGARLAGGPTCPGCSLPVA